MTNNDGHDDNGHDDGDNGAFEHEHDGAMEHADFDSHDDHDAAKGGMGGKLRQAWDTRPAFKFVVLIVAVFAVGVAGFSFLGGNNSGAELTRLGRPPTMKEAPGGAVSPYMRQQTELANKERAEQASATGGSAMPTPIGQSTDVGNFGNAEKKDDPLNELRAETERLKKEQAQQQVQIKQQQQVIQQRAPEQFDNTLAEAMQRQMQQLLESWKPTGIKDVMVTKAEDIKNEKAAAQGAVAANGTVLQSGEADQTKIVVSAGTVSYAQLLTEANSDVPGPILAQIVSGPLAGARAVGTFQVSAGYEKYLVLKFALADKRGKDYSINAIALDPNTTLGGMATEVDERYLVRVILPAAAGFLQGFGQELGQGNSSTYTSGDTTITTIASNGYRQGIYNGMGQAAQTMGQFFQNQANLTKPLVRVAAGTPIGMFFTAPVTEPNASANATAQQQQQQQQAVQTGVPNYGGIGQGIGQGGQGMGVVPGYGGNAAAAAAASGLPYPNYAAPGYGYSSNLVNRYPANAAGSTGYSPYVQNFGQ